MALRVCLALVHRKGGLGRSNDYTSGRLAGGCQGRRRILHARGPRAAASGGGGGLTAVERLCYHRTIHQNVRSDCRRGNLI